MDIPYDFNYIDGRLGVTLKQDIISTDDQIEVEELHRMMEQDAFDTDEYLRDKAEEVAEDEADAELSDRQWAHKDVGMCEGDFD